MWLIKHFDKTETRCFFIPRATDTLCSQQSMLQGTDKHELSHNPV